MCSYGSVNGLPDCLHQDYITETIRNKWNWTGFVVSDWYVLTLIPMFAFVVLLNNRAGRSSMGTQLLIISDAIDNHHAYVHNGTYVSNHFRA